MELITTYKVFGEATGRKDRCKLAGIVNVDGLPASRRIAVFDRKSCLLLSSTMSSPTTGAWDVTGLPEYPEMGLLVVAFDTEGKYNAEVADYVSQVAFA